MNSEIFKSKTFWSGVALVLGGAAGYATGEMTLPEAVQVAGPGVVGIFLRQGMKTETAETPEK